MSPSTDVRAQRAELRQPLLPGSTSNQTASALRVQGHDVREPQKVERLGPRAAVESTVPMGEAPEANHASLVRVQLEPEVREAFGVSASDSR